MFSRITRTIAVVSVAWFLGGCIEPVADPVMPGEQLTAMARKPGDPGAASDRVLLQARLAPVGDSKARGMVLIEIVGGHLTVSVHANRLDPLQHIPQHIHLNPVCDPGGGILLNLDANLTVPGEGPGVGAAYPVSNRAGVVNYYASRSLADLLAAVNTHRDAGLASIEELLSWLDLENRNAHMHVAFGPPFPAVNCGEIIRLN